MTVSRDRVPTVSPIGGDTVGHSHGLAGDRVPDTVGHGGTRWDTVSPKIEKDEWPERLAAIVAAAEQRRDQRRQQRQQLAGRRTAGLKARHNAKLNRKEG